LIDALGVDSTIWEHDERIGLCISALLVSDAHVPQSHAAPDVHEEVAVLPHLINETSAVLESLAGHHVVGQAHEGRRAIRARLSPTEIDFPAQSIDAQPRNLLARYPVEPGRIPFASVHPIGSVRPEKGRLVPDAQAVDVVQAGVEVFDGENVIAVVQLAMGDAQACLPGVRAPGAGVRNLGIGIPGFRLEHAIVEHDPAGLEGRGKCRFDPAARMSVETEEVILEFASVEQVAAVSVGDAGGLERRVFENPGVDIIVDLPVARHAFANRDRADLLDPPDSHDDGKGGSAGGSQVLLSFEIDIACGGSNVDAVEPPLVQGCDDCAQDAGEATGFESNRVALGAADENRRTGFSQAGRGPSDLGFE